MNGQDEQSRGLLTWTSQQGGKWPTENVRSRLARHCHYGDAPIGEMPKIFAVVLLVRGGGCMLD